MVNGIGPVQYGGAAWSASAPAAAAQGVPAQSAAFNAANGLGVDVRISPEGRAAAQGSLDGLEPAEECQTCANRKYVDGSDDSSVSFQSPTHISPQMSGMKVAAHEREHVVNERASAQEDDRRVVHQSVSLQYAICPECGRTYTSGGVTRTVTAKEKQAEEAYSQAMKMGEDIKAGKIPA